MIETYELMYDEPKENSGLLPMSNLENLKHNVHKKCGKDVVRIQADIDKEIYDYIFHHVIAYTYGSRQCIIAFFFQRLYEHCLKIGIPKVWDDDTSKKFLETLNNLNFEHVGTLKLDDDPGKCLCEL